MQRGCLISGGSDEGGRAVRELVEFGVDVIDTGFPGRIA